MLLKATSSAKTDQSDRLHLYTALVIIGTKLPCYRWRDKKRRKVLSALIHTCHCHPYAFNKLCCKYAWTLRYRTNRIFRR